MRSPGLLGGAIASALLVALSGCGAPFLHSPLQGTRPALDPGLIGEWIASEPVAIRAVLRAPEAAGGPYTGRLIATNDDGETTADLVVDIQLAEIGDAVYADLFLARPDRDRLVESYGFLAVPVHQVVRLQRDGDSLVVRAIQGDWLEAHAAGDAISHERIAVGGGDVVLITAPSDRARKLIERHADEPGVLGDPVVFHRVGD